MQNRWLQLFAGVVCMVMIANLQYGWTLFVQPIHREVRLERCGHPGRLQHLRHHRGLAGAARRLVRRPLRARGPSW